jgi:hypothetical protein
MPNVALFVEDFAHETFLKAMVQRLGEEHHVDVALQLFNLSPCSGTSRKSVDEAAKSVLRNP